MRLINSGRDGWAALVVEGGRRAIRGFGMASARMRPDPDFLVIGAKRGGSTSFYFDLITHPQVALLFPRPDRLPKATATKGIHYFDSNYHRGHLWYASHLPSARVRRRQEAVAGTPIVVGEASPYYLFHPLAAQRAAHHLPHIQLIAVLRDPVLRAHSHWKERAREGREPLPFLDALLQEEARVGKDHQRLRAEADFYSYACEHQTYLGQSRYGEGIDSWLHFFDRSQLHLVRSEDYYADPATALNGAAAHLGIDHGCFKPGPPRNAAPGDDLDPGARDFLQTRLHADALQLRERTGITWDWV